MTNSYIELHPAEPGKMLNFKDFTPFIQLDGVSEADREVFISFLSNLFEKSSLVWWPGGCHSCEYLEGKANEVILKHKYNISVEPRSYIVDAHFWLIVRIYGSQDDFIVDPFGVPTSGIDYYKNPRSIIPFFGPVQNAVASSKEVYIEGKPLGPRGYYVFHP